MPSEGFGNSGSRLWGLGEYAGHPYTFCEIREDGGSRQVHHLPESLIATIRKASEQEREKRREKEAAMKATEAVAIPTRTSNQGLLSSLFRVPFR